MSLSKRVRPIVFLAAATSLAQAAFGQAKTGGGTTAPPPSTGAPGGTTSIPGTISNPTNNTGNNPNQAAMAAPIFISGRVVMEDGTPPPGQGVVIERVCGAQVHALGFTDSKGYFGVQLSFGGGPMQGASQVAGLEDASETSVPMRMGSNLPGGSTGSNSPSMSRTNTAMGTDMRLMNCDLRAKLAGYRSQTVSLANRRPLDDPDVGTILLHRLIGPEGGGAVSASMLAVPKDARKAFERGQEAAKKQKVTDALKDYAKAVEIYPQFATAWFEMGMLEASHGSDEDAHKSFEEAVKADPKMVTPYLQLAFLEVTARNWQAVADWTGQVVKLDSFSYPVAYFFNAVANFNVGNLGAAELSARQAEKLDTKHAYPRAAHLLGLILAQRHDYLGAADAFRDFLKFAPASPEAPTVRAQLEEADKLSVGDMPQVVKDK